MMMVTRKYLVEQKKTLLYMIGGFLGFFMILGLWFGWLGSSPTDGFFALYSLMAGLVCAFVASKMMFDMTRKEGRTSLLMLPATAADKYVPRLIAVFPGMILLAVAGYIVFSYSMILAMGLSYDIWLPIYNPFADMNDAFFTATAVLTTGFVLNEAIFIFGAVAWPRKSFLKTIGIIIILQLLFSVSAILFMRTGVQIQILDEDAFTWCVVGVTTAISAAIIYWSFIKFKRSVVI